MDANSDYYEILQVRASASQEVIRAAYRALAQRYHPDNAGPEGQAAMVDINVAYEILGDPRRRAEYDRERRRSPNDQARPATHSGAPRAERSATGQPRADHPTNGQWWEGSAGPPPGRPFGSVLRFGRHRGWSLGEIARYDPGYLEWLERKPEGRPYLDEIDDILVKVGFRQVRHRNGQEARGPLRG
jgi:curved DNA-binding protein CbpA